MGRKVVWAMALVMTAVVSAGLVGGQVGGFLWWGTHEPIYIFGDDEFTFSNGVMSGSGTEIDPYIIEGWSIAPANADYGVYVDHTTKYFVVRDCVIEGARVAGIYFNSIENGRVEKVQIMRSDTAVFLLNSRDNRIADNVIAECRYGVVMAAQSQENVITGNSFFDNGLAGYDPQAWNQWYEGTRGNYWSDYAGVDQNKDGVGDEPYYPLGDARPLIAAPAELTHVAPAGPSYAGNLVAPDGSLVVTSQTPITLAASDPGSGLAEIKYSIDGGAWVTYSTPILLKGDDGPRKIVYYGVDRLGNAEPKKTVSFLLDNHAPQTLMEIGDPKYTDSRGTWVTSSTRITLRRTQESTHGRAETYYRINDGAWLRYSVPFRITGDDGARSVSYYSRNASGIVEAVQTKILLKDDAPPTSRGAKTETPSGASTGSASGATTASVGTSTTTKPVTTVTATTPTTTATTSAAMPVASATPATPTTSSSTAATAPSAPPPTTTAATPAAPSSTPAAGTWTTAAPQVSTATTSTSEPGAATATVTSAKDGATQAELSGAALGQTGTTSKPSPTQTESAVPPETTPATPPATPPPPSNTPPSE